MKKIHKISKMIALTLVLAIMVSLIPVTNASANTVAYRGYIDRNFTWRSAPEKTYLDRDFDCIYLGAISVGDEADILMCHIEDISEDHPGVYSTAISFPADGEAHYFPFNFPKGRYDIKITGRSDIVKSYVAVYFVLEEPLISFDFPWPTNN